jgi:hypothetical protein
MGVKMGAKIKFILAEDLLLIHCPDKEVARHLTLEMLIKVIESENLELAPRAESMVNDKFAIIDYIDSL